MLNSSNRACTAAPSAEALPAVQVTQPPSVEVSWPGLHGTGSTGSTSARGVHALTMPASHPEHVFCRYANAENLAPPPLRASMIAFELE
jgi:hypothetical protein